MSYSIPEYMPILSGGCHESPKDGACFMEYVSILAGEQFNDSPVCSDLGVTTICQVVNDHVSDEARQRLVEQIPRVVDTVLDWQYTDSERYAAMWQEIAEDATAERNPEIDVMEPTQNDLRSAYRAMSLGAWGTASMWFKNATAHAVTYLNQEDRFLPDDDRTIAAFERFLDLWELKTGHEPFPADLSMLEVMKRELEVRR